MTSADLIAFEREVADAWEAGKIRGPVHLAGGNEDQLTGIFKEIKREDWVFSTWRSSYHALLHGVPRELVMADILAGKSMFLHYPEYRFFTSSIVGGILPIACGVAAAGAKVWAFIGDMTASIGAYEDALNYAMGHDLPIRFVVENNGLSTNTPTREVWGDQESKKPVAFKTSVYSYQRTYPHVGSGKYIAF
jgi:pyruvate dehydrogenase E1 component alpha subunit